MKRTLICGSTVVANGRVGVIADGALVVEDGIIVDVGPRSQLEHLGPFDAVLGGPDRMIIPGFVNGHYHSECWTGPGLFERVFELDSLFIGSSLIDTSEEIIELLATFGLAHAAKGGQTTLIDTFYGRPWLPRLGAEGVLRAYEAVGQRVALGITMRDQNRYTHEDDGLFLSRFSQPIAEEIRASPLGYAWPIEDQFEVFDDLFQEFDGRGGKTRIILAPDWTPACSDDLFQRCRHTANEYATTISTHVLETRAEFAWTLKNVGPSAMRRLLDLGLLGEDVTASHFVWATDEDIEILADTGTVAVTCPGSNLKTSAGLCRVRDILDAGGSVSIGTDGASIGDREDFLEEIRLAGLLQRSPSEISAHRIDSETLLRSATEVGARPAGFGGIVGALVPGHDADLVCIRKDRILFPSTRYVNHPEVDVLVDRADAADIEFVMVAGEKIVENGKVLNIDEDRLLDRINELSEELYCPTPEATRRRELATMMTSEIAKLGNEWYSIPVEQPATIMNTRSAPKKIESDDATLA